MNPFRKLYDVYIAWRRDKPEWIPNSEMPTDPTKLARYFSGRKQSREEPYLGADGLQAVDVDRIFYELNRGDDDGKKHETRQSEKHSKQLEGQVQEEMPRNQVSEESKRRS